MACLLSKPQKKEYATVRHRSPPHCALIIRQPQWVGLSSIFSRSRLPIDYRPPEAARGVSSG